MATNFWESTHCKKWLKKSQVVTAKTQENNMLNATELFAVKFYHCHVMQILAKKLNMSQKVIGTASTFYRRLYYKRTYYEYNPSLYLVGCMYLSCKLEETALHQGQAEVMIHTMKVIDPRFNFKLEDLMKAEYKLLEELEFDLIVFSPYETLSEYVVDAKIDDHIQSVWSMVSDTFKLTDICLSYPPHVITLSCIFLCAMNEGIDILSWFAGLNIDMREIADVAGKINFAYNMFKNVSKTDVQSALYKLQSALNVCSAGSQQQPIPLTQ